MSICAVKLSEYSDNSVAEKEYLSKDSVKVENGLAKYRHHMKVSPFVYHFEHDGSLIAFNSMSQALIRLDGDDVEKFKNMTKGTLTEDCFFLHSMIKYEFITLATRDETAELKSKMMSSRYRTDSLNLTLLTTGFCNFKCPYCYEGHKDDFSMMSQNVQERIIELVQALSRKIMGCTVMWFGGEPLLAFKVIEDLSPRLIEVCDEKNIKFSGSITTNGYLLDKSKAEKLAKFRVHSVQITMDGAREDHNHKRMLLNEKGTFDKILSNIVEALEFLEHITIRVNIDKMNAPNIEKFLYELKKNKLENKVSIYFSKIFSSSINKDFNQDNIMSDAEFLNFQENMYIQMDEEGFKYPNYRLFPKLKASNCIATTATSYIIGPNGELYKCTAEIGNKSKIIGNILDRNDDLISGIGDQNQAHSFKYMSFDNTQHPICSKCSFLPVCMGGCAKQFMETNGPGENCALRNGFKNTIRNHAEAIFNVKPSKLQLIH